jgi:uncharacterized membrane protein
MTGAAGNAEERSERIVLAMVAARIGMSVQSILITLALGSDTLRLWWLLFAGLAIVYGVAGWRYPSAELRERRVLVLLAFVDLGLTAYEAYTVFSNQITENDRFFWINAGTLCIQLIPPLVIAALVGRSIANMRQTAPDGEVGSFALPDGTIIEFDSDEDY